MKPLLTLMIATFFILTFSLVSVNATDQLGIFQRDSNISLLQICDNCTSINITTLKYPNQTFDNVNWVMTKNVSTFNYTFTNTGLVGNYFYTTCGNPNGIYTCENVDFIINPLGIESTNESTTMINIGVWFFLILGIVFFIGFIFVKGTPYKITFVVVAAYFFLIALSIVNVNISNEIINPDIISLMDNLTGITFIMYWFLGAFLAITWIFTWFNTYFYKQNLRKMQSYGGDFGI